MNTAKKLTRLTGPRTALLLIAFCWTFTGLAQNKNDSIYSFTHNQVQHFLRVKVELDNALETNHLLVNRLAGCQNREAKLQAEVENKKKKLKRTRWIAGGSGALALLFTVFTFSK